jgi:predicted Rossmann fold nucleotide-binding protein DprA/Smf involved in DNA uptake
MCPVVEILPYGLGGQASPPPFTTRLSVCGPEDLFSAASAMERNALIYAFGQATVVCHARFRVGGTWHGATDALRRRLGPVLVPSDGEPAHRALIALGAIPFGDPSELPALLNSSLDGLEFRSPAVLPGF